MSTLVETAPRTIWLCVSDDEDDNDKPYPELYAEDAEITWSTDQPVAVTVEYVRTDIAKAERDALAAQLATAKADRNTYDSAHKNEAAAHLRTMADLAAARANTEASVNAARLVATEKLDYLRAERDRLRQHLHDEHQRHIGTMDERDALAALLREASDDWVPHASSLSAAIVDALRQMGKEKT